MLVKQGQAVFKSKISSILTNFDQWKMWKAKTEQCWKTILENYLLVDLKRQNDKQTRKITIKGIINRKRNARWFYFRFFLSRKLIVKKRQMTFWKIYDLNHRLNFETKLSNNWFNFPASPVTIAQKRILYVKKNLWKNIKMLPTKIFVSQNCVYRILANPSKTVSLEVVPERCKRFLCFFLL